MKEKSFLKVISIIAILLTLCFVGCKDDPTTEKPVISSIDRTPESVTSEDDVTVTATVTIKEPATIKSVVLKYTVDEGTEQDVAMTKGDGNVYSGTIPAQAADSVVKYWIVATSNEDEVTTSTTYSYTVGEEEEEDDATIDIIEIKINEVSGVGGDDEKFYELINTGTVAVNLEGWTLEYNANGATNGAWPPTGNQGITWTGLETHIIEPGELLLLQGRDNPPGTNPGSFTTGLTAARKLIITLRDPDGNVIDECKRAEDTGDFAITDKSYSRIPDGTGEFYFTETTAGVTNGTDTTGLTLVPQEPIIKPVISNVAKDPVSVTPDDDVTVSATVTITSPATISSVVLKYKVGSGAEQDVTMTKGNGDDYSGTIPKQAVDSEVEYRIIATSNGGEVTTSTTSSYTVVAVTIPYENLVLNEVNGALAENSRYIEIYNKGGVAINLAGVTAHYSNSEPANYSLSWTGLDTQIAPANGFIVIMQDRTATPAPGTYTTGLSANNVNVRIQLRAPGGAVLDTYEKLPNTNSNGTYPALVNRAHARIPDGTGDWYYTADDTGTKGTTNGTLPVPADYVQFGDEESTLQVLPETETLMILQLNNHGNNNGGFPRSLVELYNNTDDEIDFDADDYYLHISNGTTWSAPIKLEGSVLSKHSFLIVGNLDVTGTGTNAPRAAITVWDMEASFERFNNSGNNYAVAILKDHGTTLTGNPFGDAALTEKYIDMFGTSGFFETAAGSASAPQCPRRTSLTDNDNNETDFAQVDYRNASAIDLTNVWPRSTEDGAWNPMTGETLE